MGTGSHPGLQSFASSILVRESMNEHQLAQNRSKAMHRRRLITRGLLVIALIAASCLGIGLKRAAIANGAHRPPSDDEVESAQKTSDLMLATLFAALTQEFDETEASNVEEGKRSISLIFNDDNKDMRL